MKEKMGQMDGLTFFNYFTSKDPIAKERTGRGALPIDATSLVTNDRLDQLYRTVLLLEKQQQQQQEGKKQVLLLFVSLFNSL